MYQYDTLVEALNDLQKRGYTYNFNLGGDCIECKEAKLLLQPEEFEVVEYYRFEGDSNPDDNSIVYAIESTDGQKGVLVNAYGVYADTNSNKLVEKLKIHH